MLQNISGDQQINPVPVHGGSGSKTSIPVPVRTGSRSVRPPATGSGSVRGLPVMS